MGKKEKEREPMDKGITMKNELLNHRTQISQMKMNFLKKIPENEFLY